MERLFSEKIAHLLEHPHDEVCRREVASLIEEHPHLVEEYIEQWRVHSHLQWSLAPAPVLEIAKRAFETSDAPTRRRPRIVGALGVTAATLALVALGVVFYWRIAPVGQVVSTHEIAWADGTQPLAIGDTFRRGVMEATTGSCMLRFNSGVELMCDGAFRLRVVNDMLVELDHGKLRAKVPGHARGFSIDTPDTLLVDQGTEFGVNTETGDGTKVVVFRGEVDVHTKYRSRNGAMRRLSQGEAAQLLSGRNILDRVTQVTSGGPPMNWSASGNSGALLSIRDNIRAADSLKYYNVVVGGLHEDVPAWVDRVHEWNGITPDGIPEIVRGADYAMTFNDDRYNPSFRMYVAIHRPAILYIFIDNRIAPLPDWLLRDFADTGQDLGLDEGWHVYYQMESARGAGQSIDQTFSIWSRIVPEPAELELRSIGAPPDFGMYGLAAKPLESVDDDESAGMSRRQPVFGLEHWGRRWETYAKSCRCGILAAQAKSPQRVLYDANSLHPAGNALLQLVGAGRR